MLTRPVEHDSVSRPYLPRKKHGRFVVAIILSCAGLLACVVAVFPRQFMHQVEISLVRQPVPYTQLFFSNPADIPDRLHFGQQNKFKFTIVNDQGQSQLYKYTVMMSTTRSSKIVSKGSVVIGNGQRITRTISVVPKSRRSRYLVTVVLNTTGQSIDFYGDTP